MPNATRSLVLIVFIAIKCIRNKIFSTEFDIFLEICRNLP